MNNITKRVALAAIGATSVLTMLSATALSAYAADTKINVGALRFTSHSASFVAYERAYFKDEGLDVPFKFFQAAQPMAVAVASKDVDYAVTAISGGLISLAEKGAAMSNQPVDAVVQSHRTYRLARYIQVRLARANLLHTQGGKPRKAAGIGTHAPENGA